MFSIELHEVGKKFGKQWLFKQLQFAFYQGKSYAITGNNGSGKSTLLQLLLGYQSITKGEIIWQVNQQKISAEQVVKYAGFVGPYLDLPDELTLTEQLKFHFTFKEIRSQMEISDIINAIGLSNSADKKLKYFSSGMRQRVKLAQLFYTNLPVLFFDEPCTNLDESGIKWYRDEIKSCIKDRLIIIASNQTFEYDFVDEVMVIPTII
ncbi:MAG: ATP-binding cassette domain-containing protein [Bacteroidia bacterium]|jgi:ABC-type multidrug transport system ATPase subunit|nr:ATP-binding cassette domain-containing protein [Bacteroidia bacterium]